MRLVFLGTPEMAVPPLEALVDAGHDIALVVTRPDTRRGRGGATSPSPVKAAARRLGLAVSHAVDDVIGVGADLGVVVAFGQIIRPHVLAQVPMVNLHFSLLPRWRGAAPIQRAIMSGDAETGACVMQMDEGLDTGDICLCERLPISVGMTAGELHDHLAGLGAPLMVEALAKLDTGTLACAAHPGDGVTYAAKIDKAEARIDFSRSAGDVLNHIHGLSPFPGAWLEALGEGGPVRVKILKAEVKFADKVDKKCLGLPTAPTLLFPGICADASLANVEDCVIAAARCEVWL